jgi:hypothetical protein
MLAWIVVLFLIAVEGVVLAWWLRKEYYRFIFNSWAPLIYSGVLAADFIVGWLVSTIEEPGGTIGMQFLAVLGIMLFVILLLGTFFVRWVVAHDMTDIPGSKK